MPCDTGCILAADLSLFAGDYQSSERTFQLLTQAAGRAGRGDRPGEVIIQTYQPEHYCIQTAAAQDYDSFYSQEIRFRQMLHYPPDRQMMVMLAEGEHDQQTGQAVQKLREIAGEADFEAVEFIGPSRARYCKGERSVQIHNVHETSGHQRTDAAQGFPGRISEMVTAVLKYIFYF